MCGSDGGWDGQGRAEAGFRVTKWTTVPDLALLRPATPRSDTPPQAH